MEEDEFGIQMEKLLEEDSCNVHQVKDDLFARLTALQGKPLRGNGARYRIGLQQAQIA